MKLIVALLSVALLCGCDAAKDKVEGAALDAATAIGKTGVLKGFAPHDKAEAAAVCTRKVLDVLHSENDYTDYKLLPLKIEVEGYNKYYVEIGSLMSTGRAKCHTDDGVVVSLTGV